MTKIKTSLAAMLILALGAPAKTQTQSSAEFEEAVAIVDTAVLFAIGAREAEQALRGSFGWPTFQEGFVESVYFRFDPDGYARFSSSPRLDEDVFEVQCATGSTACLAKKQGIEIGLTPEGRIQLRFPGITPNDSFFVSDRKTELPLPPTVLEPLDARLETLLASGGELIIKREQEVIQGISLSGFSAVTTYLRWIAQQQSPRVFPRGWPVPAQSQVQNVAGLTQPNSWASGNAAPQATQTTWDTQLNQRSQKPALVGQPQTQQFARSAGSIGGLAMPATDSNAQIQMEANLRALQAEVQMLRGQTNQSPATSIGSAWPQGQNGFNQIEYPQNLDASQSFAEQARARNLQQPDPQFGRQNFERSGWQNPTAQSTAQNWSQHNTLPDQKTHADLMRVMTDLDSRLQRLEYNITIFQGEITTKINALSATSLLPATSVASNWIGQSVQVKDPNAGPAPNTLVSENERLRTLENLLMQRLNTDPQTSSLTPTENGVVTPGKVSLDQSLVEDLLTSLDSPAAPVETPQTAPVVETEKEGEEFVTLSEYLNRVLKAETTNKTDAAQK